MKQVLRDVVENNKYNNVDISYFQIASAINFDENTWNTIHGTTEDTSFFKDGEYSKELG